MNKSSSYFVDIIPVTIDPFLQCTYVLPLLLSIILTPDSCHLKQLIVINYFTFNNYVYQLQSICNFTQFSIRELLSNLLSFLLVFFLLFQFTGFLCGLFAIFFFICKNNFQDLFFFRILFNFLPRFFIFLFENFLKFSSFLSLLQFYSIILFLFL